MKKWNVTELETMKVVDLRRVLGQQNKLVRAREKTMQREQYESRLKDFVGPQGVVPVRGLKKQELILQILGTNKFITSKQGSVSQIRDSERKALKTLHDKGYDFINHGNIKDFGRFMDDVRERHGKLKFDSETAINIYKKAEKRGIDADGLNDVFGRFMDSEKHLKDLEQALDGVKAYRTSNIAKIQRTLEFLGW